MNRFLLFITSTIFAIAADTGFVSGQQKKTPSAARDLLPVSIQFSPQPESPDHPVTPMRRLPQQSIRDIQKNGFTNLWIYRFSGDSTRKLLNYAQSLGMSIDYMTSGFELFDRYHAPAISVYSPDYAKEIRKKIARGLAPVKDIRHIHSVFPFQDEPFHAGPEMFDYSDDAKSEFRKRYGYPMPVNPDSARENPAHWLDLLNFQSNTFRDGWKQVYEAVKEFDPRPKIVMTHDSHNPFGAGVKSNSKVAMDDVFHWGADFADIFVYDIYPYMTFDYRYGELGKLPKPRISQMHYTISQLRNLTSTYGKELGFWVGTYNKAWFTRFRGAVRKSQYWSEKEMSFTAIAQGANYIISPSDYDGTNLPVDSLHWKDYGQAMKLIRKAGPGLLHTPKLKARACFFFPRTQYLELQEEYFNVGLSFELFLRAFGELDIIHEEQVKDDKLNGYQVLILADVKLLPEEVAKRIKAFVQKGGIVISDCLPQLNADRQTLKEMAGLFGVSRAETERVVQEGQWVPFANIPQKMSFPPPENQKKAVPRTDRINASALGAHYCFGVVSPRVMEPTDGSVLLRMQSGEPGLVKHECGKGNAYLLGFCLQDTYFSTWKDNDTAARSQLRMLLHNIFRDSKMRSHIYSSNPDIEASVRANSSQAYVFVINHEASGAGTEVRLTDLGFRIGKISDVESGETISFKQEDGSCRFNVKAPPGTVRLLRVLP